MPNAPKFQARRSNPSERIKTQFISKTLRELAVNIRNAQDAVVDEWNLFGDGTLRAWLQGHFAVEDIEGGGKLHMRYLNYARFLDMPDSRRHDARLKRDGYHLYNRIIFGFLYNQALPTLRYGYTDEVKAKFREQLEEAMAPYVTYESINKI